MVQEDRWIVPFFGCQNALSVFQVGVWRFTADPANTSLACFLVACQFAGGPMPDGGLVLGRGAFVVRAVRLGGPKVRKARKNLADAQ